jgi:hypothetical protein
MSRRPSAWWYLLCLLFVIAGIGLGVRIGIGEFRDIAKSYQVLGSSNRGVVELKGGRREHVWAVYTDGRDLSNAPVPTANVIVIGPGDRDVSVTAPPRARMTFMSSQQSAIAIASFRAPVDGSYEVRVDLGNPADQPDKITLGSLDVGRSGARIVMPMALGVLAAISWAVVLTVLRMRRRGPQPPEMPPPSISV